MVAALATAAITALLKSASVAVPLIVTVTEAVFGADQEHRPPLAIVKVPVWSDAFSSLMVTDCVDASLPTACEVAVIANVTAASISVTVRLAALWRGRRRADSVRYNLPARRVSDSVWPPSSTSWSLNAVRLTLKLFGSPAPQVNVTLVAV